MYYTTIVSADYLAHHGIQGQKWGVRRYQNYDGSYTQAGLKRYDVAKNLHDKARSDYESGNITKQELKAANKNEKDAYRQLRRDHKADLGAELYRQGKGINQNNAKGLIAGKILGAIGTAGAAAAYAGYRQGNSKLAAVGTGIFAASAGAAVATGIILRQQNTKLRQFYAHSGASIDRGNKRVEKMLSNKGNTKVNEINAKVTSIDKKGRPVLEFDNPAALKDALKKNKRVDINYTVG